MHWLILDNAQAPAIGKHLGIASTKQAQLWFFSCIFASQYHQKRYAKSSFHVGIDGNDFLFVEIITNIEIKKNLINLSLWRFNTNWTVNRKEYVEG